MTIAARFTADQLVVSTQYATFERAVATANETIGLCKLIQHAYPDARFAVDGLQGEGTPAVDHRGRIDVFTSTDGDWAGFIDVTYIRGFSVRDHYRYQFEGPFVDKGNANYYGNGKVWRKDPIKLVEVIQKQNCIRGKNPLELYKIERENLQKASTTRLLHLENNARDLIRLSEEQAVRLALGAKPSSELQDLVAVARRLWSNIVFKVQVELVEQNAAAAGRLGVEPWPVHATDGLHALDKVLKTLTSEADA